MRRAETCRHPGRGALRGAALALLVGLAGCSGNGLVSDTAPAPDPAAPAAATAGGPAAVTAPAPLGGEPPRWQVGDRWRWSDGYALEVIKVEPGRTTFERTDAEEQWQQREALFLVGLKSSTTTRQMVFRTADPMELFPLRVGKQTVFEREYLADGVLRRHRTSWVVEGRERIEVPAGEFDTWVLVRRTRSMTSEWTGYERWYYSPVARHYVRLEYRYGDQPPGTRVLMDYTVR